MMKLKNMLLVVCVFVLCAPLSVTYVAADSPAIPSPFQMTFDDGRKIFYYTPRYYYSVDGEARPKTGLYYNTDPLINIYYYDETSLWPGLGFELYEGSVLFSEDGMYFVNFPWASNQGIGVNGFGAWDYNGETSGTAILFFDEGLLIKEYQVKDLLMDVSKGGVSVSHIFWEKTQDRTFDSEQNILTVTTLDGIVYRFDISTGELISSSATQSLVQVRAIMLRVLSSIKVGFSVFKTV
ncbi:MAG: hypothetical protein FWH42_00150 [Dehalococcoidia bacterium]|nr:hypothetical protein [Dehalococcoidia bacterium]